MNTFVWVSKGNVFFFSFFLQKQGGQQRDNSYIIPLSFLSVKLSRCMVFKWDATKQQPF